MGTGRVVPKSALDNAKLNIIKEVQSITDSSCTDLYLKTGELLDIPGLLQEAWQTDGGNERIIKIKEVFENLQTMVNDLNKMISIIDTGGIKYTEEQHTKEISSERVGGKS